MRIELVRLIPPHQLPNDHGARLRDPQRLQRSLLKLPTRGRPDGWIIEQILAWEKYRLEAVLMPLIMAVEASESGFREKCEKPRSHHLRQARFQGRKSDRPPHVYYIKSAGSRYADANQRSDGKRLGSFPKKQILTREQARFIIWCLTYDRIQQKAGGSRYHSYGLLTKLAKTFGVTRECIVQINKRRTWRCINWPKPKQLGGLPNIQAMSTETYSQPQRRKNGQK